MREIEIMLYCLLHGYTVKTCREIIPYQSSNALQNIWPFLKKSITGNGAAYKKHLEETVGLLFSLGSGKGPSVHGSTGAVRPKQAPDTQAFSRTSLKKPHENSQATAQERMAEIGATNN
jgi:hypothetical protein